MTHRDNEEKLFVRSVGISKRNQIRIENKYSATVQMEWLLSKFEFRQFDINLNSSCYESSLMTSSNTSSVKSVMLS